MIVTKAVALVDDVETDNPNGAFEVILSVDTLDRDGEIVDKYAFDPLPDHISFDIDHGMTVMTTIGSGTPSYNDAGQLVVKGTYASTSLAQDVRTLVSEGHVRTTSVTFMAAQREEDEKGVTHVQKAELLNGTFTPVPSNRESIVLSSKSMKAMLGVDAALDAAAADTKDTSPEPDVTPAAPDAPVEPVEPHVTEPATTTEVPAAVVPVEPDVTPAAPTITNPTPAENVAVVPPPATVGGVSSEPADASKSADNAAAAAAEKSTADVTEKSTENDAEAVAQFAITESAARLAFRG